MIHPEKQRPANIQVSQSSMLFIFSFFLNSSPIQTHSFNSIAEAFPGEKFEPPKDRIPSNLTARNQKPRAQKIPRPAKTYPAINLSTREIQPQLELDYSLLLSLIKLRNRFSRPEPLHLSKCPTKDKHLPPRKPHISPQPSSPTYTPHSHYPRLQSDQMVDLKLNSGP